MDTEQAFVEAVHPFIDKADAMRMLREIRSAYSAPDRHHHDWRHVTEMAADLDRFASDPSVDLHDVLLGIVFHDIRCDPRRSDNEEVSARLADECLRLLPSLRRSRISSLVLATDHKRPVTTREEAVIVDLDLAVLGSSPERYAAYVDGVRREYAFVSEKDWRNGRSAVLEGFLRRDHVYNTPEMRHLEARARENLSGELNALSVSSERVPAEGR